MNYWNFNLNDKAVAKPDPKKARLDLIEKAVTSEIYINVCKIKFN